MNRYLTQVIENFETLEHDTFCEFVVEVNTHTCTWGMLEKRCRQVIYSMDQHAGEQGVVLIFLPHCKDLFPVFIGSMLGGYVPSLMPCTSSKQDSKLYWQSHQELINTINPVLLVTNRDMHEQMKKAGLNVQNSKVLLIENIGSSVGEFRSQSDDAIAFLQHSSGTTGLKKGVMLTYSAIYQHSEAYGRSLDLSPEDVIVSWLPTYHDMGLVACLITPIYHGVKTVQMSAFDWLNRPNKFFNLIKDHKGTLCWLPNFAFEHMINTLGKYATRFDLSSMRAFISCSEPCKASTFQRFNDAFEIAGVSASKLQCCYAMAETVFAVTQSELNSAHLPLSVNPEKLNRGDSIELLASSNTAIELLSSGTVVNELEVNILDENGDNLEEGRIGEIVISGGYLFSGYNREPEKSLKALRNGQYHSNDLGFIHAGHLYVLGRIDDLIIINGRNIYAHQVESLVGKVDGIKPGRAVAISVFDEKAGSEVMIILAERTQQTSHSDTEITESIIQKVQSELDVVPRSIEIKDAGTLIKTSSGKISRKENHKRYCSEQHSHFAADVA